MTNPNLPRYPRLHLGKNQLAPINQATDNLPQNSRLDLAKISAWDQVKSNLSKLLKVTFILLFVGGIAGLGVDLSKKYVKWQQMQKVNQANDLLAQEKYAAAIAAYDQLLQTNSEQAHLLWINRGYAWLGLNEYDQMQQSCSTATVIKPQASLAWNCHGEALYRLGQNQQALQAFNQGISIDPDNPTFWLNKSTILSELQQYQKAIAASKKGSDLLLKNKSPDSYVKSQLAIAFNQQGQSWLKLKQNQQALTAFKQALEYSSDYLPALQGSGIALYELGRYQNATSIFSQILQQSEFKQLTDEQQAINWLYQGISLCETDQINSASQAFEQVLQLSKNPQYRQLAQAGCGIR
ncbi:MAG: tetratricopeptide repeat protein [Cyanobacteria bacterium P01_A01_bin.83]